MKKIYFIIAVLCIASLFASCNQDQAPDVLGFGDEVEVEMSIITSSMSQTRAKIDEEDIINNLCVLVFDAKDAETEGDAKFLYYRHAWLNGDNYRAILSTGSNRKIYLAANAKDLIEGAQLNKDVDTYASVRNKLIIKSEANPKGPKVLVNNKLPMWGIIDGVKTISESDDFVNLGTVKLLRSVASADISVKDVDFDFVGAYIVRATNQGYLMHESSNVKTENGNLVIDKPMVPNGTIYNFGNEDSERWFHDATIDKYGFQSVLNKFYMFENDATASTASQTPQKYYTKMIVEGKYNNGGSTFYPLAFRNKNNEKVQVARNRKFEIFVNNVHGPGYPSIDEAKDSEDVNMGYEVVFWDDGYIDENIIVDGPYYVSFSGAKTILLANNANSKAKRWFSTNALIWDVDKPTNLTWSFGTITSTTPVATSNSIQNDRFKVELKKDTDDTESYYLEITALVDYKEEVAVFGEHIATLSIKMGRIQFEITIEQVENGWKDGGNQNETLE